MHSNFPAYRHNEAFRRIAVMLLALAALAERAAGRSWPVRYVVVWLLRPAEAIVRGLAAELGCVAAPRILSDESGNWPDDRPNNRPPGGPDEASRLARIFEALATVFFALSRPASRLTSVARQQGLGYLLASGPDAVQLDHLLAALRPRYADSS